MHGNSDLWKIESAVNRRLDLNCFRVLFRGFSSPELSRSYVTMASYWKSQPRKFCEVCKCWLSDNKASIEFHERGKSHIAKKEKQITQLRRKSQQQWKTQQKAGQYLKQMENAAIEKYKEDLREKGIELRDNRNKDKPVVPKKSNLRKPAPKPIYEPFKRMWSQQVSPEGHVYYWNSETGESQWEKPVGFIPNEVTPKNQKHKLEEEGEVGDSTEGGTQISQTEPPNKKPAHPYGSWSVVREIDPEKKEKFVNLELPTKVENSNEGIIDRTALEMKESEPEKIKFKEKTIKSLGDDSEPAVFKKKVNKQRSIRKRIEE